MDIPLYNYKQKCAQRVHMFPPQHAAGLSGLIYFFIYHLGSKFLLFCFLPLSFSFQLCPCIFSGLRPQSVFFFPSPSLRPSRAAPLTLTPLLPFSHPPPPICPVFILSQRNSENYVEVYPSEFVGLYIYIYTCSDGSKR